MEVVVVRPPICFFCFCRRFLMLRMRLVLTQLMLKMLRRSYDWVSH